MNHRAQQPSVVLLPQPPPPKKAPYVQLPIFIGGERKKPIYSFSHYRKLVFGKANKNVTLGSIILLILIADDELYFQNDNEKQTFPQLCPFTTHHLGEKKRKKRKCLSVGGLKFPTSPPPPNHTRKKL